MDLVREESWANISAASEEAAELGEGKLEATARWALGNLMTSKETTLGAERDWAVAGAIFESKSGVAHARAMERAHVAASQGARKRKSIFLSEGSRSVEEGGVSLGFWGGSSWCMHAPWVMIVYDRIRWREFRWLG